VRALRSHKMDSPAATNPAGIVAIGNRFGHRTDMFRPIRRRHDHGERRPGVKWPTTMPPEEDFSSPNWIQPFAQSEGCRGVAMFGNGGMYSALHHPDPVAWQQIAGVILSSCS